MQLRKSSRDSDQRSSRSTLQVQQPEMMGQWRSWMLTTLSGWLKVHPTVISSWSGVPLGLIFIIIFFFARTATHVWPRTYGHVRAKEWPVWLLFLARGLKVFFVFFWFARTGMHWSIYNSSCVCVCVWPRPLFLTNHWSDLIETCQVYCWGPEYVPFQGLILIGQAVPKLQPFICQPMTGHCAMTSRLMSQLFICFFFPRTGHARTGTRERRNGLCGCCFWHAVRRFFLFFLHVRPRTYGHALVYRKAII